MRREQLNEKKIQSSQKLHYYYPSYLRVYNYEYLVAICVFVQRENISSFPSKEGNLLCQYFLPLKQVPLFSITHTETRVGRTILFRVNPVSVLSLFFFFYCGVARRRDFREVDVRMIYRWYTLRSCLCFLLG